MFADVVLHRRIPKGLESFTYTVPPGLNVQEGQIVRVPFKKQTISGVVRRIHSDAPRYPTKAVNEGLLLSLPQKQWELGLWMSEYYHCSLSPIIDHFIPEKIWNPSAAKKRRGPKSVPKKNVDASLEDASHKKDATLEKIASDLLRTSVKKLFIEETHLDRPAFYGALRTALPKDSQLLILLPELFSLQHCAKNFSLYYGGLSEGEKARLWEEVRTGKLQTIAATRAGLFLPFKKLGAVILDFEHHESYKEKRAPYYHALNVAEHLAEIWDVPLVVISGSPRIETLHKAETGEYEKYPYTRGQKPAAVTLINMRNERMAGNKGLFGEATAEKMAHTLAQNRQILIFIHRTGEAGALICHDCGNVFRCSSCQSALTLHTGAQLKCHVCKTAWPVPAECPSCGNVKLKSLGFGTEGVEKEVKHLYEKAKILRLDREAAPTRKKVMTALDEKSLHKADIIIGTQIIEKPLNLPRLSLCIAAMPDPLLNFPHYRASERVFQLMTHLRHMAPQGELVIQTFLPDQSIFRALAENNLKSFWDEELATRKKLNLPPFGTKLDGH